MCSPMIDVSGNQLILTGTHLDVRVEHRPAVAATPRPKRPAGAHVGARDEVITDRNLFQGVFSHAGEGQLQRGLAQEHSDE